MNERIEYTELAKAKVSNSRNVIISKCNNGGFAIAQQIQANDEMSNGVIKTVAIFMKGAIHIDDVETLKQVRDAINLAICKENGEFEKN